jgi:uncharacterized membrane protein YedE/YeeE
MSTTSRDIPLTDEQPVEPLGSGPAGSGETAGSLLVYLLLGTAFGVVLTKSEAVSWFRIQEMFRFQSFHMYGIMGAAFFVGALSLFIIRRSGVRTVRGDRIEIPQKGMTPGLRRYWMGGTVFGLGWALLGACPGPMFALLGGGATVILLPLLTALVGTYTYAILRPRLPH